MQTLTIEVDNDKAVKLIEELEALNILRIIDDKPINTEEKLSESIAGSLSEEQAKDIEQELEAMRREWNRSI